MNVLEIKNLRKRFDSNEVLRGLNLSVPKHCIFGFIGKNGCSGTNNVVIVVLVV